MSGRFLVCVAHMIIIALTEQDLVAPPVVGVFPVAVALEAGVVLELIVELGVGVDPVPCWTTTQFPNPAVVLKD